MYSSQLDAASLLIISCLHSDPFFVSFLWLFNDMYNNGLMTFKYSLKDGTLHNKIASIKFSSEIVIVEINCRDRQCRFSCRLTIHCPSCSGADIIRKQKRKERQ